MELVNENKYIFGAYLNTAYDNFNDACSAILVKLGNTKSGSKENAYQNLFGKLKELETNQEQKQITIQKYRKELDRYFPFFVILDNNQNTSYADIVNTLGEQLNNLRNFHTHLVHNPYEIREIAGKNLFTQTELIYDQALLLIRKRMKPEAEHLSHLYRLDKEKNKNPNFRYEFSCEKEGLTIFSESGLAFYISLFLSKRDGIQLLKKISGFKRSDDIPYRLTTEVFTTLRMHLPKQSDKLIHRQNEDESLAMDILNEITKCPKELYDHLPDKVKSDFIITNTQEGEGDEDTDIIGERIRYKDRYEQQMLRVLESDAEFSELGFYLYLGNAYLRQYEKHYIDGSKDKRTLTTPLYGFAKLNDSFFPKALPHTLDQLEEGDVKDEPEFLSLFGEKLQTNSGIPVIHTTYLESRGEEENEIPFPSVRESYPFYIVNDNKIGIKFLDPDNTQHFPEFNTDDSGKLKVKNPVPDVWISKYELPAMAFYAYLKKKHVDELQGTKSIKDILEDAKKGYSKPKEKNRKSARERIEMALDRYLKDTNQQTERILKYKETGNYKIGELADELTRDILWLQPSHKEGKDKVTGANFQALQYALARYSYMRGNLRRIFGQANLIDSKNRHPFLSDIDPQKSSDFLDFYLIYLRNKAKYLKSQKDKLAKGKSNIQFHPVRKLVKEMQKGYDPQIPEATFLGRNLFRQYIIEGMSRIRADLNNAISANPEIGCSQLITLYLDKMENSSSQLFYEEDRNYRIRGKKYEFDNQTQCIAERERHLKKYYAEPDLKKERRDILENERQIRMRLTQDQTLFLWMKECLPTGLNVLKDIKMCNLSNTLLDQIQEFNFETVVNSISITGNIKLKDYGRVNGLFKQKLPNGLIGFIFKLKNELSINNDIILPIEYIEREIGSFETLRPSIIALIQKLEDKCIQYNCVPKAHNKGGFYNFRELTKLLKSKGLNLNTFESVESLLNGILELRNCFAHSDYPQKEGISICSDFSMSENDWNRVIVEPENNSYNQTFAFLLKEWLKNRIEKLIEALDESANHPHFLQPSSIVTN